MMTSEEIKKSVVYTVANLLGISEGSVKMNSEIGKDLGADLLDIVEIIMVLEDKFGIYIDDPATAAARALTVGDLVECVAGAINGKG